jgi:hypothetical protein
MHAAAGESPHRHLYQYCGDIPPIEMETAYYALRSKGPLIVRKDRRVQAGSVWLLLRGLSMVELNTEPGPPVKALKPASLWTHRGDSHRR